MLCHYPQYVPGQLDQRKIGESERDTCAGPTPGGGENLVPILSQVASLWRNDVRVYSLYDPDTILFSGLLLISRRILMASIFAICDLDLVDPAQVALGQVALGPISI